MASSKFQALWNHPAGPKTSRLYNPIPSLQHYNFVSLFKCLMLSHHEIEFFSILIVYLWC